MSRFVSVAGQQVTELVDRIAEAGRLSRGRALFRKGSVSDLAVVDGSVIASVRGSEGDHYETSIGTASAPPGVVRQVGHANRQDQNRDLAGHENVEMLLTEGVDVCPREVDLGFNCDCADWDEPCKHVIAVLLAFADRVDLDITELLIWRGIDLNQMEPPEPADDRPEESNDRSKKLSELEALLGDTAVRVPKHRPRNLEPEPLVIEPALTEFFGVGLAIEPIDMSKIEPPPPLFAEVQLGPLAELGPEFAKALTTITARLEAVFKQR